ncbi:3-oxoacyl-[acyl-carrier protein] reductase [Cutibacterium acnes JCM 18918]|nr:3-oxoacyl-[acyl-carrier protein] reductase [Cutibacterium acnes JCM 18918]
MDLGLNGRTALITGADSGIGWHTAKLLLAEGAKVAITDLDSDELTQAAQALDVADDRLVALPADVTDADSLAKLHQQVKDALGPIDILVQSAGVTGAQGKFHEIDEEGWRSTLDIDLMGPVRVLREFLDDLRTGGWGRVVLLASEDGVQPYDDEIPYCAAKPEYWLWLRVCRGPMPVKDSSSTPFLQPSSIPR